MFLAVPTLKNRCEMGSACSSSNVVVGDTSDVYPPLLHLEEIAPRSATPPPPPPRFIAVTSAHRGVSESEAPHHDSDQVVEVEVKTSVLRGGASDESSPMLVEVVPPLPPSTGGAECRGLDDLAAAQEARLLAQFPIVLQVATPLTSGAADWPTRSHNHAGSTSEDRRSQHTNPTAGTATTLLSSRWTASGVPSHPDASMMSSSALWDAAGPRQAENWLQQAVSDSTEDIAAAGGETQANERGNSDGSRPQPATPSAPRMPIFGRQMSSSGSFMNAGAEAADEGTSFPSEGSNGVPKMSLADGGDAVASSAVATRTPIHHHPYLGGSTPSIVDPLGASNCVSDSARQRGGLRRGSSAASSVEDPTLFLNEVASSWSTMPAGASVVRMADSMRAELQLTPLPSASSQQPAAAAA